MRSMGGLAAAGEGAALARSSIDMGSREGGGGSRVFTDLVLALQLKVGELDCDILKVNRYFSCAFRLICRQQTNTADSGCEHDKCPNSTRLFIFLEIHPSICKLANFGLIPVSQIGGYNTKCVAYTVNIS